MPQIVELNPTTIAGVVVGFRQLRGWSQETLAELAKVNVRSVQRVEAGRPASSETLRALARAFDAEDLDCFLKSHSVLTAEEIATERERLARDFVEIAVTTPASGRALAAATDEADASVMHHFDDPPKSVEETFAALVDYLRDYGDCSDCYTEVQRLDAFRDLDRYLAQVAVAGYAVAVGWNTTSLHSTAAPEGAMPWRVLYFVCHPAKKPLSRLFVPRRPNW